MYLSETYEKKWQPVLEHPDLPKITDSYRRAVTATILENQERAQKEDAAFLYEAAPTNSTGSSVANWDPILISLVRRAMPNLIAYDIAGVQPMTGPTGLIFAMRSRYTSQTGAEAMFNEADTDFSSRNAAGDSTLPGVGGGSSAQAGTNPAVLNDSPAGAYTTGTGMSTATAEALGDSGSNAFAEMAFSIEKSTVTARSRALKAEYTMELAQDLKAIHGLDAETELANILSAEILAEINREVVRTIYSVAEKGASANTGTVNTTTEGIFDLDTDSNGRWSVERFKGLMFQVEREANAIAQRTRRGKGNILITSSDVASALQMAGVLDYAPALNNNLSVDDTGNTFAGVLNGRFRVYIDPYSANNTASQYFIVGYKGTSPYDAGIFYCPYVPLQMVRAVGQDTFQPKIGFKTRYGLVANPFAQTGAISGAATAVNDAGNLNSNRYYRRVKVANLM
jgi:hypothetical protein